MPLTDAENKELRRLLQKQAHSEEHPVHDDADGFDSYDPATGMFHNSFTGEFMNLWEIGEGQTPPGAMTDGAKRREPDSHAEDAVVKRAMMPKAKGRPQMYQIATGASSPYSATAGSVPFPMDPSASGTNMPSMMPDLPQGIEDVEMWGKTIIEFGQYKDQELSYFELISSSDDRMMSYVKWCKARTKSASGQLKDLCNYMVHMQDTGVMSSNSTIPGTQQVRKFKA